MRFKEQPVYEIDKRSGALPRTLRKLATGLNVPPRELVVREG